jgi:hypothetical protein
MALAVSWWWPGDVFWVIWCRSGDALVIVGDRLVVAGAPVLALGLSIRFAKCVGVLGVGGAAQTEQTWSYEHRLGPTRAPQNLKVVSRVHRTGSCLKLRMFICLRVAPNQK